MMGQTEKGSEVCRLDCGGNWLITEFTGSFMGQPFQGKGFTGFDASKSAYSGVWIDSSGAPMSVYADGQFAKDGKSFKATVEGLGMDAVREHEVSLTGYALRTLAERFGDDLTIHGPSEPAERGGVMSFSYKDVHPHDLTQVFDEHGVCVRAGHHCAKPLMRELGVAATARASLYVYNDEADVDALADAIDAAAEFFSF